MDRSSGTPHQEPDGVWVAVAGLVTKSEDWAFIDQAVTAHTEGRLTPIDAAKVKWWAADIQNEVRDACVSKIWAGVERDHEGAPRARREGVRSRATASASGHT